VEHLPVLTVESLAFLRPERGGVFVDCTVGLGGHAEALLTSDSELRLIGIDRDSAALDMARMRLAPFAERVVLQQANFAELGETVGGLGFERVDGILADLGVSTMQLETPERGFSFRREGPLDMRMGLGELTAGEIVNRYSEEELSKIFREYGEERDARRIARAVAGAREEAPISTTLELRDVILRAKRRKGRRHGEQIDPATRTFQALRIEVNRELAGLKTLMDEAVGMLEREGRLVVISYHSLEDRIVKHALRNFARGEIDPITGRTRSETQLIELLTKKPVRPGTAEISANPRSRSARLRAARRL